MSDHLDHNGIGDVGPGFMEAAGRSVRDGVLAYATGLVLAILLTIASFYVLRTPLIWGPAIPVALAALAVAQIGVHLVFFLHITTAPDNANNVLALAFGVLICVLVIGGSLWIMAAMNDNMILMNGSTPTGHTMPMH